MFTRTPYTTWTVRKFAVLASNQTEHRAGFQTEKLSGNPNKRNEKKTRVFSCSPEFHPDSSLELEPVAAY